MADKRTSGVFKGLESSDPVTVQDVAISLELAEGVVVVHERCLDGQNFREIARYTETAEDDYFGARPAIHRLRCIECPPPPADDLVSAHYVLAGS